MGREEGEERGLFELELSEVAGIIVGLTGLPTAKEDSDPLEGQSPDGGVVAVSAAAE